MKNAWLIIFPLIFALVSSYTCPETLIDSKSYTCSSPKVFDSTSFNLDPGQQIIFLMFELRVTDFCNIPQTDPFDLAVMSLMMDGEERKLMAFSYDPLSKKVSVASQDKNGLQVGASITLSGEILDQWIHFSGEIVTFANYPYPFFSSIQGTAKSYEATDARYNVYQLDDSLKIYFCSSINGANPFNCDVKNALLSPERISNNIGSNWTPFSFGTVLLGNYEMKETSGYSLADSANNVGVAYLGGSTANSDDSMNSPAHLPGGGLQFTSSNQYVTIPEFKPAAVDEITTVSFTVSYWMRVASFPSQDAYILRNANANGEQNIFAMKLLTSGGISLQDYLSSSSGPALPLNKWRHVTASFFRTSDGTTWTTWGEDYSSYGGTSSVTPNFNDQSTVKFIFGGPDGFIGDLGGIQIFSPGSYLQSPTCTPTTCSLMLGFSPPQCLIPACPEGTYNSEWTICKNCVSNCKVCDDDSTCQTCNSGFEKVDNLCYTACASKTFRDTDKVCKACPSDCEVCVDASTCDTCDPGFENIDNLCYTPCAARHFRDTDKVCKACPADCQECTDTSTCDTCDPGFESVDNLCYTPCAAKTFRDADKVCKACPTDCQECTDASTCDTCDSGFENVDNLCYTPCSARNFRDTDKVCKACPADCQECTDASTCDTCDSGFEMVDNLCYTPCAAKTFRDTDKVCKACPTDCQVCTGASTCQTCESGFEKVNNLCFCPSKTYKDSNNVCKDCFSDCATCSGDASNNCLTCSSPNVLINGECKDPECDCKCTCSFVKGKPVCTCSCPCESKA